MSDEGLPTLESIFEENFSDTESDEVDAPLVSDEIDDIVEEQSGDASDGPAKLSDLLIEDDEEETQSDDDGQGVTAPVDLAQEIDLPNGERVAIGELAKRNEELRKLMTQRTQEIADEKREFESERATLTAAKELRDLIQEDPVGTIADMAFRAGIIDERTAQEVARGRKSVTADDVIPSRQSEQDIEAMIEEKAAAKLEELLASNPVMQEYETKQVQSQVNSIFEYIEGEHEVQLDDADRQVVMQKAVEWDEGNLEYVYLRLTKELEKKQANKKRVSDASPKKSLRGVQPTDADTVTEPPKTLAEAWKRTEAILGA